MTSFHGSNCSLEPKACRKKLSPGKKLILAVLKFMVSMATSNAILQNGDVPAKTTKYQLFLSLGYYTWYQNKAYAYIIRS